MIVTGKNYPQYSGQDLDARRKRMTEQEREYLLCVLQIRPDLLTWRVPVRQEAIRNAKIVKDWLHGKRSSDLARLWKLTRSRVNQIIGRQLLLLDRYSRISFLRDCLVPILEEEEDAR